VLFAKQLITDTTLPMTEVALAAGFGSVRRFNATFRTLYGRAPGSLRRTGATPASAIGLSLAFKPPYGWDALIGFLSARAIRGVECVGPECYARSIALAGAVGTVTVRPVPGRAELAATIRFPVVAALPAIVARLRSLFDLGADPAVIGAHLAADPTLAPLVAARPGLRVPGAWDGFELAVRGILGQQITVGAATVLARKLVAAYGAALPPADDPALAGLTHVFPAPERLAAAEDIGIRLGMPRQRAAAIVALARAAAADPGLFQPGRGLDATIVRLCALPGIGAWTAQYIAMRALREPDAFPAGDIGLLRALATPAGRPSVAELAARAEAWRPWRAYAALHLWAADPGGARERRKETAHEPGARADVVTDRHDSAGL
jgi:AraC family transcriptional regulator of adaptative response / DNA-3-methyladenine glycosylase II